MIYYTWQQILPDGTRGAVCRGLFTSRAQAFEYANAKPDTPRIDGPIPDVFDVEMFGRRGWYLLSIFV